MNKSALPLVALSLALSGSASAAAIGLFDFGNARGTATAQNFIDTGMTQISTSDTVTLMTDTTLNATVANTPFALGASGLSLAVNDKTGFFTYGNSDWTGNTDAALMGDGWLVNGLGTTGFRTFTLSGLSTALSANTTYRIYLLGSYGATEFSTFGAVTYNGINHGDFTAVGVAGTGAGITNASSTAVAIDFTTGAVPTDTLTFNLLRGGSSGAAALQGFAITAVPEPSTYGLIGAGALAAVALVRRRRKVA